MSTKFYFFVLVLVFMQSCSIELDSINNENKNECINNFNIYWSKETTAEKRLLISQILEDMVYVEGDYFMMGVNQEYDSLARNNETPAHPVRLTNYYIMAHELTFEQVKGLIGLVDGMDEYKTLENRIRFRWSDWQKVLDELSNCTGLKFNYPTEAQWEFAARGGTKSSGYIFPGSNNLSDVWTSDENGEGTIANELGLYNLACGKSEWCLDRYNDYSGIVLEYNPCCNVYKHETVPAHVVRGGCYLSNSTTTLWTSGYSLKEIDCRSCRSTTRSWCSDKSQLHYIGLRPVINF